MRFTIAQLRFFVTELRFYRIDGKLRRCGNASVRQKHQKIVFKRVCPEIYKAYTKQVSSLARSTQQLCEIIDTVREKYLRLVIVCSITLDCRSGQPAPMSEAFLQMAVVFSQLELSMIRMRVRSGMANAKGKGKQIGRPQVTVESIPAIFLRHYPAYKSDHLNIGEFSRVCGLSRTTIYKYISLLEV